MIKRIYSLAMLLAAWIFISGCNNKDTAIAPPAEGSTLTAQQIVEMLRTVKTLHLKGCTIQGLLDFTAVNGNCDMIAVAPSYVEADIVFANCVFEDSVTTFSERDNAQKVYTMFEKNVVFHECEFKKGVNFTQADFRGRFDFDISKVAGDAAFDGCHFRRGVSFAMANFNGEATFVSAVFGGRGNFMKVFFRKPVIFQRCKMEDMVMFADSHFYGYTEFAKCTAYNDVDFTNSQFADRAVFMRSMYMGNIKMANCVFKKTLDFSGNTLAEQPVATNAQLPEGGVTAADNMMFQKTKLECFK
ncbi:MAG: pentapeptide repeat-containing protein [Bacteroidales bacterium]|nr:pentapeptide repeat-containing protein [Bacteroidales bacterium]